MLLFVPQHWVRRENRIWARLKFVVKKMGIAWYRQEVKKFLGFKLSDLMKI